MMENKETSRLDINPDGYWLYCVDCYTELDKPTPYCPYCGKKFENFEKYNQFLSKYKDKI